MQIGTSGLKNLGNTCYMNAPIQCLSATVPFARFFTGRFIILKKAMILLNVNFFFPLEGRWKTAINYTNPLGSKGKLTGAFAKLLHEMWGGDLPYLTPIDFRVLIIICFVLLFYIPHLLFVAIDLSIEVPIQRIGSA